MSTVSSDDANLALMLSPIKYHAYLLNSMNIRVDETLSEYFQSFEQDDESESESDQKKDLDKTSYISDEQNQLEDSNWKTNNEEGEEEEDKDNPSEDISSSKCKENYLLVDEYSEDKIQQSNITENKENNEEYMTTENNYESNRKMKKFVNPFQNLPNKSK
jgi:hypothetical protein